MKLNTTSTIPPGGWRYTQNADNGAFLKKFTSFNPYGMFLDEIYLYRRDNGLKRGTRELIDEDVQDAMCREFGGDPAYCQDDSKKNSTAESLFKFGGAVGRAAASLLVGGQILKDWFGEGLEHVSLQTAQNRSDVCTGRLSGKACPHNKSTVTEALLTGPISRFIEEQMRAKHELKLHVEGEENLHSCGVCRCPLPLKVWTPMETIARQLPDVMWDKFKEEAPANCWMLAEKPQTQTPAP